MTKYKLPLHVKNYVRQELYDFNKNKKMLSEIQAKNRNDLLTRNVLIALDKISCIENVIDRLNDDEKNLVEIIFFKKTNQSRAETFYYISKDAYYNMMNKMLYLTALELGLI